MRVTYDISTPKFEEFFNNKSGGSAYLVGTPFRRGARQSGEGLGGILSSLWRTLLPVLKNAGSALGKEALESGARFLSNISQGGDLKNALQEETSKGAKNLLQKASNKYLQKGNGRKIVGRRYVKPKTDILGTY